MPPSNPTVNLAAAILFAASLPTAAVIGWFLYAHWRRKGIPPSRIPDLAIDTGEAGLILLTLSLLVMAVGPLAYPAGMALILGFLVWKKTDLRLLWNFEKKDLGRAPVVAVGLYLAGLPVTGLLLLISLAVGQYFGWHIESQKPVQMFLEARSPWTIAQILLLACVAAPLGEELLFRGFFYPWLKGLTGRAVAMGSVSLLFGLAHMNWTAFLALAFFGLVLNLVYDYTGKLAYAIALHAAFNSSTCALLLLYKFSAHPA